MYFSCFTFHVLPSGCYLLRIEYNIKAYWKSLHVIVMDAHGIITIMWARTSLLPSLGILFE